MLRRAMVMFALPLAVLALFGALLVASRSASAEGERFRQRSRLHAEVVADALAPVLTDAAAARRRMEQQLTGSALKGLALVSAAEEVTAVGSASGDLRLEELDAEGRRTREGRYELRVPIAEGATLYAVFAPPDSTHSPWQVLLLTWAAVALACVGLGAFAGGRFSMLFDSLATSVAKAVGALRGSVDKLFATAESQLAFISAKDSGLKEMESTVMRVSQWVAQSSYSVSELVESGDKAESISSTAAAALDDASTEVLHLWSQMSVIRKSLDALSERSGMVATIAGKVQVLAERSHLLALNAAMEAARAEGHGRGFAVVSREMRNLAEGSNVSARQVRGIIAEMQNALSRTLAGAEESAESISVAATRMERALTKLHGFAKLAQTMSALSKEMSARWQGQSSVTDQMGSALLDASRNGAGEESTQGIIANATLLRSLFRSLEEVVSGRIADEVNGWTLRRPKLDGPAGGILRDVVKFVAVPFAVLVLVAGVFAVRSSQAPQDELVQSEARALLQEASLSLAQLQKGGDLATGQRLLQRMTSAPFVLEAQWLGAAGESLARVKAAEVAESSSHEAWYEQPLVTDGQKVGTLRLHVGGGALGGASTGWHVVIYLLIVALSTAVLVQFGAYFGELFERVLESIRSASSELQTSVSRLATSIEQHSAAAAEMAEKMEAARGLAANLLGETRASSQAADALSLQKRDAELDAGAATQTIEEARSSMRNVSGQMTATGEAVRQLSEKAATVVAIAATVGKIAERSNLLALNAALEASRAHDEGRGFSVVAKEMGVLAEGSKQAAGEVRTTITEIQSTIAQAVLDSQDGEQKAMRADTTAQTASEQISEFARTMLGFVSRVTEISAAALQQGSAMGELQHVVDRAYDESSAQLSSATKVREVVEDLVALSSQLVQVVDSQAGTVGKA